MARLSRTRYVCQACGAVAPKWQGRCSECGSWSTLQEEVVGRRVTGMALSLSSGAEAVPLDRLETEEEERFSTGLGELDRVLGGGIVAGSVVLLGGPPGIGKSTLLLQVAREAARQRPPVLYVSGEESPRQIRMRAERVQAACSGVQVLAETDLSAVEARLEQVQPGLVLVDSIQTLYRPELAPAPGSVTQVRECAARLMRFAKAHAIPVVLAGHVTKGGQIAGPRVLEHLVDTVLYFDGEGLHNVRALRSVKNRFGGTHEVGLFSMGPRGLEPIPDASSFFLAQRAEGVPGSVVFPSLEGSRPVLVEVQALVSEGRSPDQGVPPTRRAVGLDPNRLSLLLAVLQKRCGGFGIGSCDVYAKVAGGIRLSEPALDLPLTLAVASSRVDTCIDPATAACGEIGLGGEVRVVSGLSLRLRELAKLGFRRCLVPARSLEEEGLEEAAGVELMGVSHLGEALRAAGLAPRPRRPQPSPF